MNQNSDAQSSIVAHDNNSSDESDYSDAVVNGSEVVTFEKLCHHSEIANIHLSNSNQNVIGNSIGIYHGSITIHQQMLLAHGQHTADHNTNRSAIALSRPVFTADTARFLRIVERSEWFARPPVREMKPLELPAIRVIIAYTAGPYATTHRECAEIVRNIQANHIDRKSPPWDDIGYNFLIGGDGSIYVGRGWDFQGAHSRIYNRRSICIAFIGTFCTHPPPEQSLIAAQQLIQRGVDLKKIAKDYRLYGHRQLINTISPGNRVFEMIQTWDHWTEEVIPP